MSDEKNAISAQSGDVKLGIPTFGTVNESGTGVDVAAPIVYATQVVFPTEQSFDDNSNLTVSEFSLADVISSLVEYQKQGIYIDLADDPKEYIQVEE